MESYKELESKIMSVLTLSVAEFNEEKWEDLGLNRGDFWDKLYVSSFDLAQAETTLLNFEGTYAYLVGPLGSGKSTLVHKVYSALQNDSTRNNTCFVYDFKHRSSKYEDFDNFFDVFYRDLAEELSEDYETISGNVVEYEHILNESDFVDFIWEIKALSKSRLTLILDNIDEIHLDGVMPDLKKSMIRIRNFGKNHEILGLITIFAVRDTNFHRLHPTNSYTDWYKTAHIICEDTNVNGDGLVKEQSYGHNEKLIDDVFDLRTSIIKNRLSEPLGDYIGCIVKMLQGYSKFGSRMWNLANNSFRIYAELISEFALYLEKVQFNLPADCEKKEINYRVFRQLFFGWLYSEGYPQRFVLLSVSDIEDELCCCEKRMIVSLLYNCEKSGLRRVTVRDVAERMRRIGYLPDGVYETLFDLYKTGSLKGRMVNVFSPLAINSWEALREKDILESVIQLTPMGRESYEKNIINFELFCRAVGSSDESFSDRSSDELVEITEKVSLLLSRMGERHYEHLVTMEHAYSVGGEPFIDFFSKHFLKGGSYYIQRVCDSIIGELANYRKDCTGGRMASGRATITTKQYNDLVRKFEIIKDKIYKKWPIVRPSIHG
ncbi:MAG: ATP-binding protein [Bacteroidales bacterium]|nr:ATP-binding protein [Candidatus Latescibacterota bacterium]